MRTLPVSSVSNVLQQQNVDQRFAVVYLDRLGRGGGVGGNRCPSDQRPFAMPTRLKRTAIPPCVQDTLLSQPRRRAVPADPEAEACSVVVRPL